MALIYKPNNVNLNRFKFFEDTSDISNYNNYDFDKYRFRNTKEIDTAFLLIGVPSYWDNIVNFRNDIGESIDQLAKFCLTQDFLLADQLFEPQFINSLIQLINTNNSLALNLIILIRNMWGHSIESNTILYSEELISSFCIYLFVPFGIRDFVFEAFYFLLKNIPKNQNPIILNILVGSSLFESLNDFFHSVQSIDLSKYQSQRLQEMIERTIFLIRSLSFNPFLNPKFYPNLIHYSIIILSKNINTSHQFISIEMLHHIIIDLNAASLFISDFENISVLINFHFSNFHQVFWNLYEIDSNLWKNQICKKMYLSNDLFMNNIASLLINQRFKDHLNPVFLFLNSVMDDIWKILFSLHINFGNNNSIPLIYVILSHSNNDSSLSNKIHAGLCVSSFMLKADMEEKKEIAFNGGFDSLILLISTAEDFILINMLKCIYMLFSLFTDFLNDALKVSEILQVLENMDENYGNEELFTIRNKIIQFLHSSLENS